MTIECKKGRSPSKEKALTQAKTNDAHYHQRTFFPNRNFSISVVYLFDPQRKQHNMEKKEFCFIIYTRIFPPRCTITFSIFFSTVNEIIFSFLLLFLLILFLQKYIKRCLFFSFRWNYEFFVWMDKELKKHSFNLIF